MVRRVEVAFEADGPWVPLFVRDRDDVVVPEPEPEPEPVPGVVALPIGALAPMATKAVHLSAAATNDGGVWTFHRGWDESQEGAYLEGVGRINLNGHHVSGLKLKAEAGGAGVVNGAGSLSYFVIDCEDAGVVNVIKGHASAEGQRVSNGTVLDYFGDGIKVGLGRRLFASDVHLVADRFASVIPSSKHVDGVQVYFTGFADLSRIHVDFRDIGTVQGTTGALFTQDEASVRVRDFTVSNPGGTWRPVLLAGSGEHDVDRVRFVGDQGPNVRQPDKLAPVAVCHVRSVPVGSFTVENEIFGADTWATA